jgi:hypothetical protein
MDSSADHIKSIQCDSIYWRHELMAVAALITAENINELIGAHVRGDMGILSIDIDGNDYWVWKALSVIKPTIVICEYNSLFGSQLSISTPYTPDFHRTQAHYSNLYAGASLRALCELAEEKGYLFAGSESSGTNAFFVRREAASRVKEFAVTEGYVKLMARESRDQSGALTYVSGDDRLRLIQDLPLVDLRSGERRTIRELFYTKERSR